MARSFTVAQLLTRIRQVTDTENDGHITDAFLQAHLSSVFGEAYGAIAETGLRHFEATQSYTATGSSNLFAEPAAFLATIQLDYVEFGGTANEQRAELWEIMAQERNWVGPPFAGQTARYFEHVATNFRVHPRPPAGQIYELIYIPQPTDLSGVVTSTPVDVVTPDGESFLVNGTAVFVMRRKERDPSVEMAERDAAKERLVSWAMQRAFLQPRRRIVTSDDIDRLNAPPDFFMRRP